MKSIENIEHEGIVESIVSSTVRIRIISASACSSCHAKGACSAADLKDKLIEVVNPNSDNYKTGQKVIIIGQSNQGLKATLYAYILPTILVIFVMMTTYIITSNDLLSGGIALGSLIPYFTLIYLARKKFQKSFSFTLKPL
ncbi:MAG: SoxR reducing system RseC family protein [Marinilabiliaceae bacterium]|nr:SoxR reducing system RseC family protein [Marinilabiliaceae bacterium]